MVKKESNFLEVIKKDLEKGKAILGLERTIKELKKGNLEKIYLSSNISEKVKEDIMYYSSLQKIEIIELDIPNDELGIVCKKPFSVSIVGVLK
jgi:large subunit ribosomal protein L30e